MAYKYILNTPKDSFVTFDIFTFNSNFDFSAQEAQKTKELLTAQRDELRTIRDYFEQVSEGLPQDSAAKADLLKAAGAASTLAGLLTNMIPHAEGMYFEPLAFGVAAYLLPEKWNELTATKQDALGMLYGIDESNYAVERLIYNNNIQTLNAHAEEWKGLSAQAKAASAEYAGVFVVPELVGTLLSAAVDVFSTLTAKGTTKIVLNALQTAINWITDLPTDAKGAGIEIIQEGLQTSAELDGRRYAEISDSTGIEVSLVGNSQSGSNGYAIGQIYNTLLVSSNGASQTSDFDLAGIESDAINSVILLGSNGVDVVTIQDLSFGEVTLLTEGGADVIKIGNANVLSPGNVTINSGADGDTIEIRAGNAEIKTGAGEDTVTLISGGEFTVDTGSENDTIRIGDIGNSIINGGAGEDTVDYSGQNIEGINPVVSGVKFDLSQQGPGLIVTQGSYTHTLIDVENIILTPFDDVVIGNSDANVLDGLDGNDTLVGGGGTDTIIGGAGDDYLAADFAIVSQADPTSIIQLLARDALRGVLAGGEGYDTYLVPGIGFRSYGVTPSWLLEQDMAFIS
jgi:Ca2+-binding RTX toxin-like protein